MFENYTIRGYHKHKDAETGLTVTDVYSGKGVVKDCCEKSEWLCGKTPICSNAKSTAFLFQKSKAV